MRIALSLILSLFSIGTLAQLYGWDSNAYIPGLGRDDAVCFTLDEIVFIGSGNHGGFSESNVFYAFNTRTGGWENMAPFPGEARQYARVEEVGFKAYLIGGIDQFNNPLNDVWEYDWAENSWTQKTSFPAEPRWKAASFMTNNYVYYGTGRNWNNSFNDFWRYDPENDKWKQLPDMPVLPRNETIGFAIYNQGYIGLGIDCTNVLQQDIWAFDPFSEKWNYETDFPGGPRWYAISEVLAGFAFVGTGEDSTGTMHNDFWRYHPGTKEWEQAENLPFPARRGAAACSLPFKAIFVACGLDDSFVRLTDISRYTYHGVNPPKFSIYFNSDEQEIYVHDIPNSIFVRVLDLSGKMVFETKDRVDHVLINTNDWTQGVYIIQAGSQSSKVLVY